MTLKISRLNTVSYLMGLSILIGLLVLLHQYRIPFYLYYPNTTDTVLVSDSVDQYLFLVTSVCVPAALFLCWNDLKGKARTLVFPVVVWVVGITILPVDAQYAFPVLYVAVIILAAISFAKASWAKGRRATVTYVPLGAITVFALIECSSMYYWITSALSPLSLFGVASQNLEASLTYSAYPIAPVLLLILLFSWIWIPICTRVIRTRHSKMSEKSSEKQSGKVDRRIFLASLDLLAILSILVFYFPYAAGQNWIVGTDSLWRYLIPLNNLSGKSALQGIQASLAIYHGIYVGTLYVIERATGLTAFAIVKLAPLILIFLTSSLVFLALRNSGSYSLALLAAVCVILWLPTTIGIFGGIQDNWAAYALWMLFLVPYLNGAVKVKYTSFIAQSLLSLGIMLVHPWTWGVFVATVVVSSLLSMRSKTNLRRSLTDIISIIWLTIPVGLAAYTYVSGVRGDLTNTLSLYAFSPSHLDVMMHTFSGAWLEMFKQWSAFLSPALIIITLLGTLDLTGLEGTTKKYMLAWIAIWCVGSFLAAPLGYNPAQPATSETQLWRMLYLSPLPFLLAMGVKKCVNLSCRLEIWPRNNRAWTKKSTLFPAAICAGSLALFLTTSPVMRLIPFVSAAVAVFLLTSSSRAGSTVRVGILMVLGLIIVNAAFRSLFPLLTNPYNLLPTSPT